MNAAIFLPDMEATQQPNLDHLMVELERYRRQSVWLQQVNGLHARLACATDLRGMIEAFSVWLMPLVDHDLIAYRDSSRNRVHMVCSCHGPERRLATETATDVFAASDCMDEGGCCEWAPFFVQQWRIALGDAPGCLVVLRRDRCIEAEEAEILNNALEIMAEPMQRAMDYENLFEQARRDMLTGLDNRRVFEDRIGPMLDTALRHDRPITVASMDLDHFKQINDTLGHAAGDDALRRVAKAMSAMVRTSDLLVRMGGDEFVLVLPDTDLDAAKTLADRLCVAIDRLDIRAGDGKRLGVSIGLVQWRAEFSREEWLQRADEVLYQAKHTGRCRVCVEEGALVA